MVSRSQLLADTHEQLAHCGRDKLLNALREHFWWPGMHQDVRHCVQRSQVL